MLTGKKFRKIQQASAWVIPSFSNLPSNPIVLRGASFSGFKPSNGIISGANSHASKVPKGIERTVEKSKGAQSARPDY
jgi:hypothetical protein